MHKADFSPKVRGPLQRLADEDLIPCCGLDCKSEFAHLGNEKLICPDCGQRNSVAMHPMPCPDCGAQLICKREGVLVSIPECLCKASPERLQQAKLFDAQCAAAKQRDTEREEAVKKHRADAHACWERKEHKCKVRLTNPAAPFCKFCAKFNQEAKRA